MTEFTFAESRIGITGLGSFTNCWEDSFCAGHRWRVPFWAFPWGTPMSVAVLGCLRYCSSAVCLTQTGLLLSRSQRSPCPWNPMYFRIGCVFWGETLQFSLFLELVLAACSAYQGKHPSCTVAARHWFLPSASFGKQEVEVEVLRLYSISCLLYTL